MCSISAVQPRVCGEQATCSGVALSGSGSAPRVRGTDDATVRDLYGDRFSPACAGNSHRQSFGIRGGSVQPRVCGEQGVALPQLIVGYGSAPRVRGTEHGGNHRAFDNRFSPACAGNSRRQRRIEAHRAVQPRVCGEQIAPHLRYSNKYGSAPRVRGTGAVVLRLAPCRRFSPACAGNSRDDRDGNSRKQVQPRVCGEQEALKSVCLSPIGSAPRVRGTENIIHKK